jgi:hypothetical protein
MEPAEPKMDMKVSANIGGLALGSASLGGTHMNFGSTLVHNASVDFISLPCGTSAL